MFEYSILNSSIDAKNMQPSQAQQSWMDLGYGMFLHFGPNTFQGSSWGDGRFPAQDFAPRCLDVAQWAGMAAEAGMKYGVLTAKHHDGFCLWPSSHSQYSIKNAGVQTDIVAKYVEEFRRAGLKTGLYYSLWDRNATCYEDDEAYFAYMRAQIIELLTDYGEILELWFDGGWDKDHPTHEWMYDASWESDAQSGLTYGERWHWRELYRHIHSLQPNCLVVNNSGSDRPGGVKYHPVDLRSAEHFDFVHDEKLCKARVDPLFETESGEKFLPLEYCTSLTPGWFWNAGKSFSHFSADTIAEYLLRARDDEANLLLNIGPNSDGVLPAVHRKFLQEAKAIWENANS